MSIHRSCPSFNWVLFLLSSCKNSFYILYTSPLSDTCKYFLPNSDEFLSHLFKTLGSVLEFFCDYLADKGVRSIWEWFHKVKVKYGKYYANHINVLEWNEFKVRSWRPCSSLGSVNEWESLGFSGPQVGFCFFLFVRKNWAPKIFSCSTLCDSKVRS